MHSEYLHFFTRMMPGFIFSFLKRFYRGKNLPILQFQPHQTLWTTGEVFLSVYLTIKVTCQEIWTNNESVTTHHFYCRKIFFVLVKKSTFLLLTIHISCVKFARTSISDVVVQLCVKTWNTHISFKCDINNNKSYATARGGRSIVISHKWPVNLGTSALSS